MTNDSNNTLKDVAQYQPEELQLLGDGVRIPVTYMKSWDDGFGARGWKINASIGDPVIIASTRETGIKINTSVFVHDILDHFLSGFGVSGHRSEAMALIQLSMRTGSDPRGDYEQMVKEDIIHGRVNGESLLSFLPEELRALVPESTAMPDKEIMALLVDRVGEADLYNQLVENFFALGQRGKQHALDSWGKLGLDPEIRTEIGLRLQDILDRVDSVAEDSNTEMLNASIIINNERCQLEILTPANVESVYIA